MCVLFFPSSPCSPFLPSTTPSFLSHYLFLAEVGGDEHYGLVQLDVYVYRQSLIAATYNLPQPATALATAPRRTSAGTDLLAHLSIFRGRV